MTRWLCISARPSPHNPTCDWRCRKRRGRRVWYYGIEVRPDRRRYKPRGAKAIRLRKGDDPLVVLTDAGYTPVD